MLGKNKVKLKLVRQNIKTGDDSLCTAYQRTAVKISAKLRVILKSML
jgi:hypothetical protein